MKTRTTFNTVCFSAPFSFHCLDEMLPAGEYTIETDSERLEGVSFSAWRRLMTLIHLPMKAGSGDTSRLLAIDPAELDAILSADREAHSQEVHEREALEPQSQNGLTDSTRSTASNDNANGGVGAPTAAPA